MNITNISLKNFRNFENQTLNFHPHFNVIIGKNAQGKTNILEAVYYLGFLNSFRTKNKNDLIKKNEEHALITSTFQIENSHHDIRILLENKGRQIKLNGKRPNLFEDFYGKVPILLFEPRDVYLFRDSPSIRRKYLNRALFLDDATILKTIRNYEEVVLQKNKLLKDSLRGIDSHLLATWNEKLIELGSEIISKRLIYINKINEYLSKEYNKISKGNEKLEIFYTTKINVDENEKTLPLSEIKNRFESEIKKRESEELRRRESCVGPHRDDWKVFIDNRDVAGLGSQGENRSTIIALKLAQVNLYEKTHQSLPLFLLDDVASELDLSRQEALFRYLEKREGQVFLTTTEPDEISSYLKELGASFVVEAGCVGVI